MRTKLSFILLLLLCINMEQQIEGSPVSMSNSGSSPDLTSILAHFKDGLNAHTLLNYIKEFKLGANLLVTLMKESPPLRQVVAAASRKNVKLRVMMKAAENKFPDLKDLYHLATDNSKASIYSAIDWAAYNISDWKKFHDLIEEKDFLTSYDKLSQVISLYTGGEVNLKPSVLKALEDGRYTGQPNASPYADLVQMLVFINDNFYALRETVNFLLAHPDDYTQIADWITHMDLSHIPGLTTTEHSVNSGKYTVSGGSKANPDAAKLLEGLKHLKTLTAAPHPNQSEVEASVVLCLEGGLKILNNAVLKAEAAGKSGKSENPDRPSGVVG